MGTVIAMIMSVLVTGVSMGISLGVSKKMADDQMAESKKMAEEQSNMSIQLAKEQEERSYAYNDKIMEQNKADAVVQMKQSIDMNRNETLHQNAEYKKQVYGSSAGLKNIK